MIREHVYQLLPGWFDWPELYTDAVAAAPPVARFAEVGVWMGRSLAFLCVEAANSGKQIEIVAVDTWEGSDEPEQRAIADKIDLYLQFHRNMNICGLLDMIRVVRMDSVRAASHEEDGSFDFVFLDAGHSFADVRQDIAAWLPKVRPGGTLAGHDADYASVMAAVEELLPGRFMIHGRCWVHRKNSS